MLGRSLKTALIALLFISLSNSLWASSTIDAVIAPVRTFPGCQPIEGENPPVSLQAGMFFHYDTEKGEASLRPVAKKFESFRCGKRVATIYMYEYRDEQVAREALSHATVLIWGGNKASSHHPEAVFTVQNTLVVVSTRKPQELTDLILGRTEGNAKHD